MGLDVAERYSPPGANPGRGVSDESLPCLETHRLLRTVRLMFRPQAGDHRGDSEKLRCHPSAVLWFGVPCAIITTFFVHGEEYGYGMSKLATAPFLILLVANLILMGWFGGRAMQRVFALVFR
jgi:hypothetical protein